MRLIIDDSSFNVCMMVSRTDFATVSFVVEFRSASAFGLLDLWQSRHCLACDIVAPIQALPLRVCIKPLLPS